MKGSGGKLREPEAAGAQSGGAVRGSLWVWEARRGAPKDNPIICEAAFCLICLVGAVLFLFFICLRNRVLEDF